MSHLTCCCTASLDRCDRCDLLVGLEGFHLMSVARTPDALVLDVESCNQLAGCPGCGVIAQGHGRMVVEVIDAPWAGVPARIRWFKRRWICREHACQTVTFLEHDERVCAPRARPGDPLGLAWSGFVDRARPDPTQVEGRTRRQLRHRRSQQRANRSHQRNHRTRQTHRQRLPQPHQLPTPNAPHRRRPRRLHPHPTLKSH